MEPGIICCRHYASPLGGITLAAEADTDALCGLWFDGQKYFGNTAGARSASPVRLPVFEEACRWLDLYFSGRDPGFTPPLSLRTTPFRRAVWQELLAIPFGQTCSYAEIARRIAARSGRASMSAQAVGGAVGHNPVSLIIPCHRVVGSDGSLTGYAGGLDRKARLLRLERGEGFYSDPDRSQSVIARSA